jgi:hypothetical protein
MTSRRGSLGAREGRVEVAFRGARAHQTRAPLCGSSQGRYQNSGPSRHAATTRNGQTSQKLPGHSRQTTQLAGAGATTQPRGCPCRERLVGQFPRGVLKQNLPEAHRERATFRRAKVANSLQLRTANCSVRCSPSPDTTSIQKRTKIRGGNSAVTCPSRDFGCATRRSLESDADIARGRMCRL